MPLARNEETEAIWSWAKTENGWVVARAALAEKPHLATQRSGKWNETLLHWAGLCSLGGTMDLLALGADPNAKDSQGRSPLDWAVEKIYFIRSEMEGSPEKNPMLARSATEAESCAFALIQAGAKKLGAAAAGEGGYSLAEIAVRSGRLTLAQKLAEGHEDYFRAQGLRPFGWWLAGEWEAPAEGEKALLWLSEVIGVDADDSIFGDDKLPLGLLACQEYAEGRLPPRKLAMAHMAGARVDAIADGERDLADICAKTRDPGRVSAEIERVCGL